MRELEASLAGSRKALLALDLEDIERGTRDQVGLIRALETTGTSAEASSLRGLPPSMAEELRRCEAGVLQEARLQAALLARAQRKLRILANMLADPSLSYEFLFSKPGAQAHIL